MRKGNIMRQVWLLAVGMAILPITGLCCNSKDEELAAAKRQTAKGQLNNIIAINTGKNSPYPEYLVNRAQYGLYILDSGSYENKPVLISAGIRVWPGKNGIGLIFLDPDFQVKGMIIETNTGWRGEYSIFSWSAEDKEWYSGTILRHEAVTVEFYERETPFSSSQEGHPPLIFLPKTILNEKIRVGLVTITGETTDMVDACIWRPDE